MRTKFTCMLIALAALGHARPIAEPTVAELMSQAALAVIIKPVSTRLTDDKADDNSLRYPEQKRYQALETTCSVSLLLKGDEKSDSIKIVHFGYADRAPDFNGAVFMAFVFDPTLMVSFPSDKNLKFDAPRVLPYANGTPEYLAFLRRLPDGRYAAVTSHYEAGLSFRLLTTPWFSYRYDQRHETPKK